MPDESYSFSTARARLDDIVAQVRKKDTSLEKSLDLLEEGVRLANACTELIDHQDWTAAQATDVADDDGAETVPAPGDEVDAEARGLAGKPASLTEGTAEEVTNDAEPAVDGAEEAAGESEDPAAAER